MITEKDFEELLGVLEDVGSNNDNGVLIDYADYWKLFARLNSIWLKIYKRKHTPNPQDAKILKAADAAGMLDIKISTLYKGWKKNLYPAPLNLNTQSGWLVEELEKYLADPEAWREEKLAEAIAEEINNDMQE